MRVFYCDHYPVVLPPKHRFPMAKYALLRERLVATGLLATEQLVPAPQIDRESLVAVHAAEYVDAFLDGTLDAAAVRRLGFPWSPELVARSLASVGGTWAATRAALEDGLAGHLAGGTHHAYREFGSGFCAFNDLAVAARWALDEAGLERVLIFDVDVHQGDGTAALFERDERVFTCSLHGAKRWSAPWSRAWSAATRSSCCSRRASTPWPPIAWVAWP
jgi:acetoin utilization deacetylase AcuC-like enzyme